MSGFLKGIFGGKEEELAAEAMVNGEVLHEEDEMEQFTADVQGTMETEVEEFRQSLSADVDDDDEIDEDEVESIDEDDVIDGPALLVQGSPPPLEQKEFSTSLVWEQSRVSEAEQENVEKAQQLLESLPAETPDSVKRQIVEAALKAFEVSIEDIVSAATSEIGALRDYIDEVNERARDFALDSERRIEELEAEIARVRETISDAQLEQERLVGAATEVIEEVEPVLSFFQPDGELPPEIPSLATVEASEEEVSAEAELD